MSCLRRLFHFFRTPEKRALARFISLFLAGASWFTVIALWLCALSPYVDPRQFGAAAAYALLFPLFLGGTVGMAVLCLVFAPRRVWIPLFGLLLCSGSIRTYAPSQQRQFGRRGFGRNSGHDLQHARLRTDRQRPG